jgi:pimeloyl-ACP methyl ester carboxylesterase
MPRAQAEIVTAAGHGPSIEQADHVNARITAFIAAASKDRAR